MSKSVFQIIMCFALIGWVSTVRGADESDQSEFPKIVHQPVDMAVRFGSNAVFTTEATNGILGFQWFRNGVAMDGQTNRQLVLENVGIGDVGLYTCNISKDDGESVPTRTATLNVYVAADGGGPITVFGAPVVVSGSQ